MAPIAKPRSLQSLFLLAYCFSSVLAGTSTFKTKDFLAALDKKCGAYRERIEACPEGPFAQYVENRTNAGESYSTCLAYAYADYFNCPVPYSKNKIGTATQFIEMNAVAGYVNGMNVTIMPPVILFPQNKTRSYPDFLPILEQSCSFDFNQLANSSCCAGRTSAKGNSSALQSPQPRVCSQESFNVLACSMQAIGTYIYCTGARPLSTVPKCVNSTAQRINFVPIGYQIASTTYRCPSATKIIRHLATYNILALIWPLMNNVQLIRDLWTRFRKGSAAVSRTFELNMVAFWLTMLQKIGSTLLVAHMLSINNTRISLFKQMLIWAVRPRSACLTGLLGFLHRGWVGPGIQDMVADLILSCFGGWFALQGAASSQHSSNPLRAASGGRSYVSGGIISSCGLWILSIFVTIGTTILTLPCFWAALGHYCKAVGYIIYFLVVMPLKQLVILLKNAFRKCRKAERQPLSELEFAGLIRIAYVFLWLLSCLVFVGNWMYWKGFLFLSEDLYCPGTLKGIDVLFIGGPLLVNLVRFAASL